MVEQPNQPWSNVLEQDGRIVTVSDNPISRAMAAIAAATGRSVVVLKDDEAADPSPAAWFAAHPLDERDAVVLCDHDTPDAEPLLRSALAGPAGYVAVLGSRRRAADLFVRLAGSIDEATLARLHSPAGLDIGGKSPGDIALSVVAEIVAAAHGRSGGSMRS
jgi:xanthine/CO dehydrogenase XdhC/CoxF family maturation factor